MTTSPKLHGCQFRKVLERKIRYCCIPSDGIAMIYGIYDWKLVMASRVGSMSTGSEDLGGEQILFCITYL